MADDSAQEKTEKASSKKRADARKEGQICQSREINTVALLFFAIGFFSFFMPSILGSLITVIRDIFKECCTLEITVEILPSLLLHIFSRLALSIVPFFGLIALVAVGANVGQFGFNWATEALQPKLEKLNPIKGFKRLISLNKLFELVKNIAKVSVVGYVAYQAVEKEWDYFITIMTLEPTTIVAYMGMLAFRIAIRVVMAMTVVAVIDYLWQRYEYEKNLRMSKQDQKDEFKQVEGDPQVKNRIRRMQMETSQKRMMEKVPEADVVITNPTHFAVALKYDQGKMAAPVVVAKGRGYVAQKIREIAKENGVPILERKPLARALYKLVEVGHAIPDDLYQAVAEILAYVYRLKKKVM